MDKRIALIGVGLLILAIVLLVVLGFLFSGSASKNLQVTNLTVSSHGFSYLPITYYSNTVAIAIYSITNKPANLYLMNGSAFNAWYSHMSNSINTSGIQLAENVGVNSTYIYRNVTMQFIQLLHGPAIAANSTGKIYLVVDNTQGSKSYDSSLNATLSYYLLQPSNLAATTALGYTFLIGIIVVIAAIAVIIWGLVRKRQEKANTGNPKDDEQKSYLDQLYSGVKLNKRKKVRNSSKKVDK